jgi:hypothetical protein
MMDFSGGMELNAHRFTLGVYAEHVATFYVSLKFPYLEQSCTSKLSYSVENMLNENNGEPK